MFTAIIFGSYLLAGVVVVTMFKSHHQNRRLARVELEQRVDGLIEDHLDEHGA